ncbi:MAG: DNA replication/repair protein RecF [Candidatus Poribacteria bacterium]|nr:DNA replication/repair protein RecF [Candidatus Poribacteria bacterium]
MRLNYLLLRNFRIYVDCEIEFPNKGNLIVGGNAQGKTSLLEAIYFLSTAKSHRTYPDVELIRHNENWFYLKGMIAPVCDATTRTQPTGTHSNLIHESPLSNSAVQSSYIEGCQASADISNCYSTSSKPESQDLDSLNMTLEVSNESNGKKRFKLNGDLQRKLSEWIGQFNVVFFSPESLTLVKGAPSERRRFIDILISQLSPAYLNHLQNYQFALKQRNELLKQIRANQARSDLLEAWDSLLIDDGVSIIQTRSKMLRQLSTYAQIKHSELTGGSETLVVEYQPPEALEGIDSISQSEAVDEYLKALSCSRSQDILRGTTSVGPHRDDLKLTLETGRGEYLQRQDAKSFCSQGQQRTIALALKLGELELIRGITDKAPVVLLDDVISELDEMRSAYLFDMLQRLNSQTFITSTRREVWTESLEDSCILTIKNGQVIRQHA